MGIYFIYGAELLDELDRRFLTDTGDAGDVIGGVTLQPFKVGDVLGLDAVSLDYRILIVEGGITKGSPGVKYLYCR
ncbi:hypothetical protein ES703_97747 [subsurface metagenome]